MEQTSGQQMQVRLGANKAMMPPAEDPPARASWVDRQLLRELPNEWRVAYLFFALALMLVLGTGLMINPATISTFVDSVGVDQQPVAQTYLPLVLFPILFLYNFLWAALRSPQLLVTVVCTVYALVYALIAVRSLMRPHIEPWLAWILFYATNTKSVLFPVMLWSVMNDLSSTQYSKVAYPALVFAGQVGGLAGSLYATFVHRVGGTSGLLVVQAVALVIIAALVWFACRLAAVARPDPEPVAATLETSLQPVAGAGALEEARAPLTGTVHRSCCVVGLRAAVRKLWESVEGIALILSRPFVAGIFWIACAHLVPRVILDYQGTALTNERWPRKVDGHVVPGNKDRQTAFFAWCNVANTIGTGLLSVFGLRSLIERGGLLVTLLALPIAMVISVLLVCFYHNFWTVQAVLVVVNVIQYALNGPSREMLYVRTSKSIKYKAKSWSDMYGNFLQKTIGALINLHVNREEDTCQPHCFNPIFTGSFTVGWVVVWAIIAGLLGVKHAQLVRDDEVVS
ncbi:unnamed protein product [Symbiodinium necroappetens]|uniref:ADP,ATP carrier protein n=1 Tax=Symbiodinium necroappetens TaxID=1628268 RepID=A0A812NZF6_9DINO|nr:unnamed protein product [Symbiodinium necroappetens]